MKMLAAIVVVLIAVGTASAGDWTAPVNITNTVVTAGIHIDGLMVVVPKSDINVRIVVRWSMLGKDGAVLRTGDTSYTESQLDALLQSQGSSIAALRGILLALAAQEAKK